MIDSQAPTIAEFQQGTLPEADAEHPIIFFDGVCGLCNRFVDFVLTRDRRGLFRFAPLQGETARALLPESDWKLLDSVVLLSEQRYCKSAAALRIMAELGGGWAAAATFLRIIPGPIRDAGYWAIAQSRYRLFGKKETCRMPTPSERARFLP